ncbi:hypothetical protein ACO0KY_16215 [Undibacterium sp. Dicai25W]|uniref:hypothetical protein n=1 Tax=Undibacterium sp. Dicai25W TaxID=3413034 RepID=UPI003BF3A6F4
MNFSQFHAKQARHNLYQFAASLKSSVEVLLLAAGQIILMAIALLSWPVWQSATWMYEQLSWFNAIALFIGYSALLSSPVFLLRQRLLPTELMAWARTLPLPPHAHVLAHIAVVKLFLLPLTAGFVLSSICYWTQIAINYRVMAIGSVLLLLSLALILLFGCLILQIRYQHYESQLKRNTLTEYHSPPAQPFLQQHRHTSLLSQWYKLFFLPFWRLENGIGVQQCFLFGAAGLAQWLWLEQNSPFIRFLFCIGASSLCLLLTDRGSKAVQEQMLRLRPHLRALPLHLVRLEIMSQFMCLIPGLALVALFAILLSNKVNIHTGVVHWYIGALGIAHLCIVACSHSAAATRARILILFLAILTAIGSELWI